MEIFNIGPLELVIILVLALIVFGPERMVKYARESALWIRKIVRSPFWRDLVSTTEEIKSIPQQLVKEADLDESIREIKHLNNEIRSSVQSDEISMEDSRIDDSKELNESREPDEVKINPPS